MGMKCWFLVYTDADTPEVLRRPPSIDIAATDTLVRGLFGPCRFLSDSNLLQSADPRDGQVAAACFDGVTVLATESVGVGPLDLDLRFHSAAQGRTMYLFGLHSVSGWGSFGWWDPDGHLVRGFGGSDDGGLSENLGPALPFEAAVDSYERYDGGSWPSPPALVEEALADRLGFRFEGIPVPDGPEPSSIPLRTYR
ncbi:hypothetical protein [Gordonia sp. NB41Y]|uniref:DUF6928 family protein n=1 Tax=Gordonia sp. NB41Y TaxID=875808 RepID=UPI0002BE7491|nr:hypothetical protein [Gordonia sp. NB41Y]WLP90682.1 hypothetical protein Q9K23_24890 [Gordonia sp. NB41Y]